MKFDDLYNRVFIAEQDLPSDPNNEVASPEDVEVDPIPLPSPADVQNGNAAGGPAVTTTSLTDYMKQCNEFADKLQNEGGTCLQALVMSLDKPLTPFEGISKLSSDIEDAAEKLKRISGRLLSYNIAAQKK
jgi:hypothetical protein